MNEPTQEQIKRFWEWCGLKPIKRDDSDEICRWELPDGTWRFYEPDINLNNLFKYAPDSIVGITFRYYPGGCEYELTIHTEPGFETVKAWMENKTGDESKSKDLSNLALFWVLDKVRENESSSRIRRRWDDDLQAMWNLKGI